MYVDAHCHLDMPIFDGDRAAVVARARSLGVTQFVIAGVDRESWVRQRSVTLEGWGAFWSAGIHPVRCAEMTAQELERSLSALPACFSGEGAACAVGETGLDRRFAPKTTIPVQVESFRRHLDLACELELPIILHVVQAHGRCLEVLREHTLSKRGGMVHSFSGSIEVAEAYLDLGLCLSLSGASVRSERGRMRDVIPRIPEERLLLETDSPDQPLNRGDRNEPKSLIEIANRVGKIRGCDPTKILRDSAANCAELFGMQIEGSDE